MADPHHATDAADHDAHAYVHGEMAIQEQVKTWKLVQNLFSWGSLFISAALAFLVIWFGTAGGFMGGFGAFVVILVAGTIFLRSGSKGH